MRLEVSFTGADYFVKGFPADAKRMVYSLRAQVVPVCRIKVIFLAGPGPFHVSCSSSDFLLHSRVLEFLETGVQTIAVRRGFLNMFFLRKQFRSAADSKARLFDAEIVAGCIEVALQVIGYQVGMRLLVVQEPLTFGEGEQLFRTGGV